MPKFSDKIERCPFCKEGYIAIYRSEDEKTSRIECTNPECFWTRKPRTEEDIFCYVVALKKFMESAQELEKAYAEFILSPIIETYIQHKERQNVTSDCFSENTTQHFEDLSLTIRKSFFEAEKKKLCFACALARLGGFP